MMLTNRKRIILVVFSLSIVLSFGYVHADENPGFEFLRTEIGARAAGMGGAYTAVTGDVHSLFYNPGAIVFIRKRGASASYLNNVMDFNVGAGAYLHPISSISSFGLGIQYLDYGEFQGKDEFGQDTGTFGANDIALTGSYGRLIRSDLGIGVSLKYIQSKIAGYSATAIAGDIGILYHLPDKGVTLGISALNFGKSMDAFVNTKEDLPSQIKIGITKQLTHLPLLVSGEIRRFNDGEFFFNGGGELQLKNSIKVRLGYSSVGRDQKLGLDSDRWSGFSLGGGILIRDMMLDYSLSSMGGIGTQNRFTLSVFF